MTTTSLIAADQIFEELLGPMRTESMAHLRRLGIRSARSEADTVDLHAVTIAQILKLVDDGRVRGLLSRAQIFALYKRVGAFQTLKVIDRVAKRGRAESVYAAGRRSVSSAKTEADIDLDTNEKRIAEMRARPMTTEQIGFVLGRSATAISTQLARIRERIRDDLD